MLRNGLVLNRFSWQGGARLIVYRETGSIWLPICVVLIVPRLRIPRISYQMADDLPTLSGLQQHTQVTRLSGTEFGS